MVTENSESAKKRIMFIKGEDFNFLAYNILITLDSLKCHTAERAFVDHHKLRSYLDHRRYTGRIVGQHFGALQYNDFRRSSGCSFSHAPEPRRRPPCRADEYGGLDTLGQHRVEHLAPHRGNRDRLPVEHRDLIVDAFQRRTHQTLCCVAWPADRPRPYLDDTFLHYGSLHAIWMS